MMVRAPRAVDLLSIYRSRVFPTVEEIGFVPVTADDVISPGQNINAKIDALIDRSSAMVVEMTSSWTRAEYDIALARNRDLSAHVERGSLPIIVIVSEQSQVLVSAQIQAVVHRDGLSDDSIETFLAELSHHLIQIAGRTKESRDREAQRLLVAREYPAAVISAITQMETTLQHLLNSGRIGVSASDSRRPTGFGRLIELALKQQLIDEHEYRQMRDWMIVRNKAIHEAAPVSGKVARTIVDGVARIVRRITG